MTAASHAAPIRLGVVSTTDQARQVVRSLLKAGVTREQITVMCSDRSVAEQFREYEHAEPAGTIALRVTALGAKLGIALGAAGTVIWWLATGSGDSLAVAPIIIPGSGAFGCMVGAMASEGMTGELAEYYEHAVETGKILVAATVHGDRPGDKLAAAERVFREAGVRSIELEEE
jgi:hypothetical protein